MTKPIPNENDERLCDWVDGTMAPRDRERFEAELRVSKTLRERADAYRSAVLAVREGLATDDEPIDVAASVMARIRGDGSNGPKSSEPIVSPRLPTLPGAWWRSALVAAAMLALIFLLDRLEPRVKTTESAQAPAIVATSGGLAAEREKQKAPEMLSAAQEQQLPADPGVAAFGLPGIASPRAETPSTTVPQLRLIRAPDYKAQAALSKAGGVQTKSEVAEPKAGAAGRDAQVAQVAPKAPAPRTGGGGGGANAADDEADVSRAGGTAAPTDRFDRFGGVDVLFGELAASVRSIGPVRLAALAPSLPSADAADKVVVARSWVVTGSAADVRAFLANVSEASRAFGFEVQNGEVEASSVITRAQTSAPRPSGPASPGPQGPGGGKATEPEVRVVLVIDA